MKTIRTLLELQIAMAVGALICLVAGRSIRGASILALHYEPGTVLFFIGDVFFLTTPVAGWMLLRGRGWRHSLELAAVMLAPVAGIVGMGELTQSDYLLWLVTAMYPAMSLGMLAYVFHRRDLLREGSREVASA